MVILAATLAVMILAAVPTPTATIEEVPKPFVEEINVCSSSNDSDLEERLFASVPRPVSEQSEQKPMTVPSEMPLTADRLMQLAKQTTPSVAGPLPEEYKNFGKAATSKETLIAQGYLGKKSIMQS